MAAGTEQGQGLDGVRRLALWGAAAALMVVPIIAIRAGATAPSDPGDYVFLAVLLGGLGLALELAARVSDPLAFRVGSAIAIAAALLQTWVNLAVGIIGSEDNPANWMFGAVTAVAATGALIARGRPLPLAWAMVGAAFAQLIGFAVALAAGLGFTGPVTVFFTGLWLIAAWLFRRAATLSEAQA